MSCSADQARAWRRARVGAAVLESFVLDCMGLCAQGSGCGRHGCSIRQAKHGLCLSVRADQARARRRARVGAAVLESFVLDSMGFCAQGRSIRQAKHGLCLSARVDQARARRRARVGAAVLESFVLDCMGLCAQGSGCGRHGCSIRPAKHGLCPSAHADQARARRRARVGAAVLESFALDSMGFCAQGRCRGRSGCSIRQAKHGLCLSARADLMGQSHGIWSPSCSSS